MDDEILLGINSTDGLKFIVKLQAYGLDTPEQQIKCDMSREVHSASWN